MACADCHDSDWQTNCTMCHGGTLDATGAPPEATWGNEADAVRVGAHARHVQGGSIGRAFDCDECHVKPADALDPGHIDAPVADVVFGATATLGGSTPAWGAVGATCTGSWCHGSYTGVYDYFVWDFGADEPVSMSMTFYGGDGTPDWLGGSMTCTSCHQNPPLNGPWHGYHGGGNTCELCHPDATGVPSGTANAITGRSLHVNGAVDLAPRWRSSCFNCH